MLRRTSIYRLDRRSSPLTERPQLHKLDVAWPSSVTRPRRGGLG